MQSFGWCRPGAMNWRVSSLYTSHAGGLAAVRQRSPRLRQRQAKNLGIPLPAATQCEITAKAAVLLGPAMEELQRQAQGEVVHSDDTSLRVLSLDRDADISYARLKGPTQ
jgi:hypothetical protein